jgi:hypothetical protein
MGQSEALAAGLAVGAGDAEGVGDAVGVRDAPAGGAHAIRSRHRTPKAKACVTLDLWPVIFAAIIPPEHTFDAYAGRGVCQSAPKGG